MIYSSDDPLKPYLKEIEKIHEKYPDFGGVDAVSYTHLRAHET